MAGVWTRSGRLMKKNGTPRILMGMYYEDYECDGAHPAKVAARNAAITAMGVAGFDMVYCQLDISASSASTVAAAVAAGMEIVPEGNGNSITELVGAYPNAFSMLNVEWADGWAVGDLDSETAPNTPRYSVGQITAGAAVIHGLGSYLAYGSGGWPCGIGGHSTCIQNYFGCNLDAIGMQNYPVTGEGVGDAAARVSEEQYWSFMRTFTQGVCLPNVQCFMFPAQRLPTPAEMKKSAALAMNSLAGGIMWYVFLNADNDALTNHAAEWQAVTDIVRDIRNSEAYYLNRLALL